MESLATESSIGSVTRSALVTARKALFEDIDEPNNASRPQQDGSAPSDEWSAVRGAGRDCNSPRSRSVHSAPATVPESADVNGESTKPKSAGAYRTPISSSAKSRRAPNLAKTKSAPQVMEAMIQSTASQDAFVQLTKAKSFQGTTSFAPDTQPFESQVYTDSINGPPMRSQQITPQKVLALPDTSPQTHETSMSPTSHAGNTQETSTGKTQHTLQEVETGYVDLLQGFQQQSPAASIHSQDFDELLQTQNAESQNPETQIHAPNKTMMPETPSLARLKRKAEYELLTSATTAKKTPHYSQAFNFSAAPVMTNTQLFAAHSSPLLDGPRSDPVASRPSPTSNDLNQTSSPFRPFSSPAAVRQPERPSTAPDEPRETYMSMKESQERRRLMKEAHEAQEREERLARGEELSEEDEFQDSEDHRLQAQRNRRALSERAKQDASRLASSHRTSSSRKVKATIDLVTPGTAHRDNRISFGDLSDEEPEEEQEIAEQLPGQVRHDEEFQDYADHYTENDEYDELGQTVLKSQSNDQDKEDGNESVVESAGHNGAGVEGPELEDQNDNVKVGVHEAREARRDLGGASGTQRSTISDSQPTVYERQSQPPLTRNTTVSRRNSFVPGSHYHQGNTSEDQAVASSQRYVQLTVPASQTDETASAGDDHVPSSPPKLTAGSTLSEGSVEASLQRRGLLEQFQTHQDSTTSEVPEQEIPESDLPDLGSERPQMTREEPDGDTQDTGNVGPYSTARTHVSASAKSPAGKSSVAQSPAKIFASQQSRRTNDSPRKLVGARRFSSMTTNPTTANASFDAMEDVDAVFDAVVTEDDRAVLEATSDTSERPRAPKRRKIAREKPVSRMWDTSKRAASAESASAAQIEKHVSATDALAAESEPHLPSAECLPPALALREIPSKANEQSKPLPSDETSSRQCSSEGVLVREKAGSDAVSQLVDSRATAARAKLATRGRASRRKSNRSATVANDLASKTQATDPALSEPQTVANIERLNDSVSQADHVAFAESDVAAETSEECLTAVDDDRDDDASSEDPLQTDGNDHAELSGEVVAPKRIFAWFKGRFNAYYTATWLASSVDGTTHSVHFDDGTITTIEPHHIRSLELRVGDTVRVDKAGLRGKQYTITALGPVPQSREERALGTDVHGNVHVQVQAKTARSNTSKHATVDSEVYIVLISDIFFTPVMWPLMEGRGFKPPVSNTLVQSGSRRGRAQTPSLGSGTSNMEETPSSRGRGISISKARLITGRTSHLREASVASSASDRPMAIFSNMAFAVSYVSNEFEKGSITRTLQRHGAIVLEDGLEQLFELPSIVEALLASAKKRSPKKQQDHKAPGLQLKSQYKSIGFVAVIADRHSRRAKYMQALALGLPTLSGRWVVHSIDGNRNPTLSDGQPLPLPWDRYLLPAGESSFLGGAIRSRSLITYNAAAANISSTISRRSDLFNGDTVIIVAARKGKSGWEKRKTHAFLTLALGAANVQRVENVQEAKTAVQADSTTQLWVYVDGNVAEAENILFSKSNVGKKRKRDADADNADICKHFATHGNVRIVDDEFIVQSLILGALVI